VEVEVASKETKRKWLVIMIIIGAAILGIFFVLIVASLSFVLGLFTGSVGSAGAGLFPSLSLPPGASSAGLGFLELGRFWW
ncbi:MAG: hypothetical protein U9M92_01135, partial [Patescibacteria group bacterium]|nr:hypothetical protein [Patescibacteria group bacterium]